MIKKTVLTAAVVSLLLSGNSYAKKVLDHDSFDAWKSVRVDNLSNNGEWAAYEVNPQEGDGILTFRNTRTGKEYRIDRGYMPAFSTDGLWALAKIKPLFSATRKAKIDKKKDFDLPQDSLAVINLKTGKIEKIARVISYKLGKRGGTGFAYLSSDTALISPKALKDKKVGRPLIIRDFDGKRSLTHKWVKDYTISEDGRHLAASLKHHTSDSTAVDGVAYMRVDQVNVRDTFETGHKFYGAPVFSYAGDRMAFTVSDDSIDSGTKEVRLFAADLTPADVKIEEIAVMFPPQDMVNLNRPNPDVDPELKAKLDKEYQDYQDQKKRKTLSLNQYSVPVFSRDSKRLVVGVAPYVAPDDTTIVDFERADLDIWRWDAPYTPPQELHNVEKARKHTYPVVINMSTGNQTLLTRNPLVKVERADYWDAPVALIHDPSKMIVSQQWDYLAPEELSLIDVETGKVTPVSTAGLDTSELSPKGKFVTWYDNRKFYAYEVATGQTRCISDKLPYPVWDEDQDIPLARMPYGVAGWTDGDEAYLVYDRYDIWSLDPKGEKDPVCITAGVGRKENKRFRYQKTDTDQLAIPAGDNMLLKVFDYGDKRHGYAFLRNTGKPAAPAVKLLSENTFTQLRKAKDAPVYSYQMSNFSTSPNVYIARNGDFAKAEKVTDANPQMKDYNWGKAQLVKWYAYNGVETEGVLYTPEDLDPDKKYPMLVVFYETNSEELYRHYTMEPSWSWVNYPFYVSRGYVVFVPDVHYAPGIPGESAYNYICSGVEDLCNKYKWIDRERIGIDGQSWGGYQTAFLITRTNMFACAGSGAPVANMTSAFGGIRWESGSSRQGQYEKGQSRIGRTLWEAPELYISNSPVFFADRVKTPLLIMHNDADGAVPWYQGIELFMALRRLEKPVWMLQYNGEAHNIRARKNRKDITIRLQQFFDHYLKGSPMPEWMKNGIPATRKGQEMGTGLTKE